MDSRIMSHLPRSIKELEILKKEILNGDFGEPGDQFLSTRELAELRKVSLVTAQRILVALREEKIIELIGKKNYLCYNKKPKDEILLLEDKESGVQDNKSDAILTFGLHVTNIENPFFASIVKAAEESAVKAGYKLMVAGSSYDFEREKSIIKMFCDSGVAGIMSCPGIDADTYKIYEQVELPLVFLGRKPKETKGEAILVNNRPAAFRIAEHFIKCGFKSFAYVGLEELEYDQDPRLEGYREGLTKAGYNLPEEHILHIKANQIEDVPIIAKRFLENLEEPIAIFCFHDLIATGVLRACHELDLKLPDSVAVAGFDDLPIASQIIPSLTTVRYHVSEMADIAVQRLIKQISTGSKNDINYYVEPSLVIRESTSKKDVQESSNVELVDILYKIS